MTNKQELIIKNSFYYSLEANSSHRELACDNKDLILGFSNAGLMSSSISSNKVKNSLLINLISKKRSRDIYLMINELNRIFEYVSELSRIEKECFMNLYENGYSSHKKIKYIRKLFISNLRLLKCNTKTNKEFKLLGISLNYIIQYYRNNSNQISTNQLFYPEKYVLNEAMHKRINKLFNKSRLKIENIIIVYTHIRYEKFGLKNLKKRRRNNVQY